MRYLRPTYHEPRWTTKRRPRRAVTLTEIIVACTLLASTMALVIPMTLRLARVQRTTHEAHLAQQELSNQMDYLTTLPREALESAAEQLSLHADTAEQLAEAHLTASVTTEAPDPHDAGFRIQRELTWTNSLGHRMPPRRLTSWVYPPWDDLAGTPPTGEASPCYEPSGAAYR